MTNQTESTAECDDEGCPHYGTPHGHKEAADEVGELLLDDAERFSTLYGSLIEPLTNWYITRGCSEQEAGRHAECQIIEISTMYEQSRTPPIHPTAENKEERYSQGVCDTTLTERFYEPDCCCDTYVGNLGPCKTFEECPNGRCVYCDHEEHCGHTVNPKPSPTAEPVVEMSPERIAFEKNFIGWNHKRDDDDLYVERNLRLLWIGWLARARLNQAGGI